jgi:hypothetical protein
MNGFRTRQFLLFQPLELEQSSPLGPLVLLRFVDAVSNEGRPERQQLFEHTELGLVEYARHRLLCRVQLLHRPDRPLLNLDCYVGLQHATRLHFTRAGKRNGRLK